MVYYDMTRNDILNKFEMKNEFIPEHMIIENDYNFKDKLIKRKDLFDKILFDGSDHNFFIGEKNGVMIGYSCVHGPTYCAEIVHPFAVMGSNIIRIGTYSGLNKNKKNGRFLIPISVKGTDDVTKCYSTKTSGLKPSKKMLINIESIMKSNKIGYDKGNLISCSSILSQNKSNIKKMISQKYLGMDMITAPIFAIAKQYGVHAVALLYLFDKISMSSTTPNLNDKSLALGNNANDVMFEIIFKYLDETNNQE